MMARSISPFIFLLLCFIAKFSVANAARAVADAPSKAISAATLPEGYTYYSFINTAYKIHTEKLRWSEAKEKCTEEGGTLAVIDTEEKIKIIESLKKSQVYLWVGISRKSKAYPWLAIDGETVVSYLPWAPNEPSCSYDCIALDSRNRGVNNKNCRLRRGFVCEITE